MLEPTFKTVSVSEKATSKIMRVIMYETEEGKTCEYSLMANP